MPIFIDEYKPYDMQRQRLNTLHRYLRRLYRGETEERGRPDLKVNSYHLQAPVCVAGATRPTEAALLERILTANPTKTTLEEMPSCKQSYRELRAVDLALFAPRYIQFSLGRDFDSDLAIARGVAGELLKERKVPVRVAENLTAMLLGVHLFEEFAAECGVDLPEELGVRDAVDAVLADVLETEHGVKNALDAFLEMMGVMAVQGHLKHRVHHVFDEGRLALHLESAYDAFRAHCKQINYEGEVVDLKALRRLLVENRRQAGFVVTESERVCFNGRDNRRRATLIDLSKTKVVTADDFPDRDESRRADTSEGQPRSDFRPQHAWNDAS